MVREWECQVVAFSETSPTKRALPALRSEFKSFGFPLSCSDRVPDKFSVSGSLGSFRGLGRGVCVASVFPVFPCGARPFSGRPGAHKGFCIRWCSFPRFLFMFLLCIGSQMH